MSGIAGNPECVGVGAMVGVVWCWLVIKMVILLRNEMRGEITKYNFHLTLSISDTTLVTLKIKCGK